MIGKV